MRSIVRPAFTSSKTKMMLVFMKQCADELIGYFQKQGDVAIFNMKDIFTRYTNDLFATTVFGVTCNSLKNKDNHFYLMGKDLWNFSGIRALLFFGNTISPLLMKLVSNSFSNQKSMVFFRNRIKETVRIREENQIIRQDMIHLLTEAGKNNLEDNSDTIPSSEFAAVHEPEIARARKKQTIKISPDQVEAQAMFFFGAGFESSAVLLTYAAYELALNPDIQQKLREEISSTLEKYKGECCYEALIEMKYLDCVISETLRKWPPSTFTDRKSVQPFTIEPEKPGEKPLHLESGTLCWIPIYALHRDPQYYPDPEKFDPERFNDKNKHKIKPCTYLPFGYGARACIGSRFALLEGKLLFAKLLQEFEIIPVEKTKLPEETSQKGHRFLSAGRIWLGLKPK